MRTAPLLLVLLTACPGAADKADTAASTPCVDSALPRVGVSVTEIDFDYVALGTPVSEEITLENDGDAALAVSAIRIGAEEEGSDYTVSADTSVACVTEESVGGDTVLVLAPGCALPITVTYTPTIAGGFQDALVIESRVATGTSAVDPIHGTEVVWLAGTTDGTATGNVYAAGGIIRAEQTAMLEGETIELEIRPVSPSGTPVSVSWATDEATTGFSDPTAATTQFTAPALSGSGQAVNIYSVIMDDLGQDWTFRRIEVWPAGTELYDCDDVE